MGKIQTGWFKITFVLSVLHLNLTIVLHLNLTIAPSDRKYKSLFNVLVLECCYQYWTPAPLVQQTSKVSQWTSTSISMDLNPNKFVNRMAHSEKLKILKIQSDIRIRWTIVRNKRCILNRLVQQTSKVSQWTSTQINLSTDPLQKYKRYISESESESDVRLSEIRDVKKSCVILFKVGAGIVSTVRCEGWDINNNVVIAQIW